MSTSPWGSDLTVFTGRGRALRGLPLRRIRALALTGTVALTLGACSTAPDWAKPTTWQDAISGGAGQTESTNETVAAKQAEVEAASTDSDFPPVGTTPERPAAAGLDTREKLAGSLIADRDHARYSGEALRGGTEPPASPLPSVAAAPLPAIPSAPAEAEKAVSDAGVIPEKPIEAYTPPSRTAAAEEPAETPSAAASVEDTSDNNEIASAPMPAPEPAAVPQTAQAATPAPVQQASAPRRRPAVPPSSTPTWEAEKAAAEAGVAAPGGTESRQAAVASQPSRTPAVAPAPAPAPVASAAATSGEPQFARSSAPPLPAEVRDLVPAIVSARYDETTGSANGSSSQQAPAATPVPAPSDDGIVIDYSAIGGPAPVGPQSSYEPEQGSSDSPLAAGTGGPWQPVQVFFGHASSQLSGADLDQLAEVAAAQDARGGGIVRIVGHASSRTSNLPVEKHIVANFEMSMDRANAVASALMRLGVAPDDVVIEAVGDQAPVYYESMPAGEAGNRRAEIFLE